MKPDATIEAQIEAAWLKLIAQDDPRLYFLTACGKLRYGEAVERGGFRIRWYDKHVTLADFRARVFGVYEQLQGALHGHHR